MTQLTAALSLLLVLLFGSGCRSAEPDARVSRDGAVVTYNGRLRIEDAREAARLLVGAERLVITSDGGEVEAGTTLGRAVRENDVTVEVDTLCSSACAHYVFAVAPRSEVSRRSIVLFHTSPYTWQGFVENGRLTAPDAVAKSARDFNDVKRLYEDAGVSPELLECASRMIGVREDSLRSSADGRVFANTRFDGVYMSPAVLSEFGVRGAEIAMDLSRRADDVILLDGKRFRIVREGDCGAP